MTSVDVSPASNRIRVGNNGDGSSTPKEKSALQRANHLSTGETAGADSITEPSRRVRRQKREAIPLGEEDLPNARRTRSTEEGGKSGFGSSSSSTAEAADFPPVTATASIESAGSGSATVVAVAATSGSALGGQAAEEPETPTAKSKSRVAATSVSQVGAQTPSPILRHLAHALRQGAHAERRGDREQLCRLAHKLGRFKRNILGKTSVRASVQWEGGQEADELDARRFRLAEQKAQVDELRNSLQKPKKRQQTSATGTEGPSPEDLEEEAAEQYECKELINAKLCAINREEIELREKETRLNSDRVEFLRRFCVIDDEDRDVVGNSRLLVQRYQILRLLGKGRSRSIYRAYDLSNQQSVVLQLYRKTPDSKAAAAAECQRAKSLKHPSIATMLDSFIDADTGSYIIVWEFVEGEPLDNYIRKAGSSEKEARGIILQLLSALRYLESKRHGLDGQDLRSSRLVIRGGEVKIGTLTLPSFRKKSTASAGAPLLLQRDGSPDPGLPGLARQAPEDDPRLAPDSLPSVDETQDTMGDTDGLLLGDSLGISAAVHTVGSVLHELLFGKKAENPDTSTSAFQPEPAVVQLPDMPKLSTECRDFLLRLLDRDRCLTATEAYADPFLMPMVKKYRGGG